MGWKGDPCYYCNADLHAILAQEEGREGELWEHYDDGSATSVYPPPPWSFEWHMQGLCLCEGYHTEIKYGGIEYRIKTPAVDYGLDAEDWVQHEYEPGP